MVLEDVRQKIDSYIDNISAEDLLKTLTDKYHMQQYKMSDIDNIPDEHMVGNAQIA